MEQEELKIGDLNEIYSQAEKADKDVFAEERSNLLLIGGEHYTKKASFQQRVRDDKSLNDNQKLRLTKNHTHKVYRHYVNQILTFSPGVSILPKNDAELQDQKYAELNKAVWDDACDRHRMKERIRSWCENFIGIGACAVKLFFDPNAGHFKGWEPLYHTDESGAQITDDFGQPMQVIDENTGGLVADKTKPVFSGDFVFENIFDFNLLVHAGAADMKEADCWIIRKMVPLSDLKKKYAGDEEKLAFIQESKDESFVVFDSTKNSYERSKDHVLVREHYYRPSYNCPNGYFYISTSLGILESGELPLGEWPIIYAGFDTHPTSRRARSIIKVARPFQAEINRASSAMATHQVTIGDDKVIYQAGTKLAPGSLLPGVRGITFQGQMPTIMPGRDGSQFLSYIQSQIAEMYDVLMMEEENMEKDSGQLDSYALLFRSLKQQKKYSVYGEKFNQFLVDLCELYLTLAKEYLSDEQLLFAIGKQEQVNMPEFRKTTKLCYQVKVVEQDETIETKLGKQLTMNHYLQYVGPQLKSEDIGKIMRAMPFGNVEQAFDDLTINYDNITNDMLALDRGEFPIPGNYDDHPYIISKLSHRMKRSDFRLLAPLIQQNYSRKLSMHEQLEAVRQQKIIDAKNEYIPVGGALITCDMYVPDKDPTKQAKRVRVPYQALDWLMKNLESQGADQTKLENMNQGAVADLASQITAHNRPQLSQPPMLNQQNYPGASGGGMQSSPQLQHILR